MALCFCQQGQKRNEEGSLFDDHYSKTFLKITTALDKNPKASNLKIKLSKHNSYVSQVINEQVASQVKTEVVSSIQNPMTKHCFLQLMNSELVSRVVLMV